MKWVKDDKENWKCSVGTDKIEVNRCWNISEKSPMTFTVWVNGNTIFSKEYLNPEEAKRLAIEWVLNRQRTHEDSITK